MRPAAAAALAFLLPLALAGRPASAALTAVWAASGDDKVAREELRAAASSTATHSLAWDGTTVRLFGARNEVVGFALVLEAAGEAAKGVDVSLDELAGPGGAKIAARPASGDGVFDWTGRDLELFLVRYLPIKGLSRVANDPTYDERLVPRKLRRPWSPTLRGRAEGRGGWADRPDHDRSYPEIAVPLELDSPFTVPARRSQEVWVDVYVPKDAPAGAYAGRLKVVEDGGEPREIPVRLLVKDFALPDSPSAKTMLFYAGRDINARFFGKDPVSAERERRVKDRYFMLARRHRVALIGDSACGDAPCPEWLPRLDGSLFTAAHGYRGPGEGLGLGVFSIGTYGSWSWKDGGERDMWRHADGWESWFRAHAPDTERFLYLIDESSDTARIEQWASWLAADPGPGGALRSLATISLPKAAAKAPHLDIPVSSVSYGVPERWAGPVARYTDPREPRRRLFLYNGGRPGTGSFMTEDDGVALRALPWIQRKLGIARWFYWNATYYDDWQWGGGPTPLFSRAQTFGGKAKADPSFGLTAPAYGNGDGVLLYPGTDRVFPDESYGVDGPFASLRLKQWRRGLQDADYLALAAARDPEATRRILERLVPKAAWETGVANLQDPTYVYADVSWPTSPDAWEAARLELAGIIERAGK